MYHVNCHLCGREVRIMKYGDGWVGSCCDNIIYNHQTPPQKDTPICNLKPRNLSHAIYAALQEKE